MCLPLAERRGEKNQFSSFFALFRFPNCVLRVYWVDGSLYVYLSKLHNFFPVSEFRIGTFHFRNATQWMFFSVVRLCGRIHLIAIVRFLIFLFSQCGSSTPNNLASTFLCFLFTIGDDTSVALSCRGSL